jgi:hypothetical protein
MRLISKLRPSPAMVVALIALFFAAAGVGYAASTIDGNVLKNRSVAGTKLKKNTLTGAEIRESKLGQVPKAKSADTATSALRANTADNATHAAAADNATHAAAADNATHAASADNATHATAADGVATVSLHATKTVDAAADFASAVQVPLGSNGPFSFYGKCYVNGVAAVEATTYIASSSDTGMFDTEAEGSGYVTPSTAESDRELQDVAASKDSFDAGDGDKDFMATDGSTTIYGLVGLAAAKNGSPAAGKGPFGAGNRCMFGEVIFG